jgi:hypothetical protein
VLFINRIESVNDLYTIRENECGEMVKVPYTDILCGHETPCSTGALIGGELA